MKSPQRQSDQPATAAPPGPIKAYFLATRGPWYGFLFALPILLAYEALVLVFQPRWINGADAILQRLLMPLGVHEQSYGLLVLVLLCGIFCWQFDGSRRKLQGQPFEVRYFGGMFCESFVYALFLGEVVTRLMQLLSGGWQLQMGGGQGGPIHLLTMALGAGIYEELLFRVLLMGALLVILVPVLKVERVLAWVMAVVLSSFVFSLFHYVGSGADAFTLESFVFRFLAGAVLASLYALRGFGIAVWTHALYDLLVMFHTG